MSLPFPPAAPRPLLKSVAAFFLLFPIAATAQKPINIPADKPTIQAGINAAATGDTVLVAPGTYFENINFKGKAITVTSSAGPATTIIDGGGTVAAVSFVSGEPRAAVLSNFTITHGAPPPTNNGYVGGGVFIQSSQPTLLNNVITKNYCQNVYSTGSAPLIQGNTISSSLTPQSCFVLYTGGIMLWGALQSSNGSAANSPLVIGNTIENNTTGQSGDGGGDGGPGIAIWGGSPTIQNNIIRNNLTRSGSGGGINIVYGDGISIVQNLIYANTAGCGGGAIGSEMGSLSTTTYLLIANNTMVGNTGGNGGGYSDCRKTSEVWTAFYNGGGPSIKFVNNIFDANATPALDCGYLQGGTFGPIDEAHQSLFDHNLLYNSAGPFFASNCADTSHLHGNLVADPQFVNLSANDFHLKATSPAIDAGNGSVVQALKDLSNLSLTRDFDGNPRELDATAKGTPTIDMGAYEFGGLADGSPTRVVLSSSAISGAAGSNFKLSASLSSALGVPSGPVTFFIDSAQAGVANAVNGVATLSNLTMIPGPHVLLATYSGQGVFPPAVSIILVVNIDKYIPTLSFTSSPNPSLLNQSVTFTVTISSPDNAALTPITLSDGGTVLVTLTPNSAGTATYTTTSLVPGFHFLTANYAGDATHSSVSSFLSQNVLNGYPTTTTLSSSVNPSIFSQSVTFTATVSSPNGTPTGTVTFADGVTSLGTANLSAGVATFTIATLAVGNHPITATYVPVTTFTGSSRTLTQTVNSGNATITTLVSSQNPSSVGQSVTFTSTLTSASGTPTGTVHFFDALTLLADVPLSPAGVASYTTSTLTRGSHQISAVYTPTGLFANSNGQIVQVVNGTASGVSLANNPNPAFALQAVKLRAIVTSATGIPTGTVTFRDGPTTLATIPVNPTGQALFSTTTLTPGTHTLFADYSGDATYNSATTSAPQTILTNATTTTISTSLNPATFTQPITFTAQITSPTGTPTGTVTLQIGTQTPATASLNPAGVATFTISSLPAGTYAVTATYNPSSAFTASASTPLQQVVRPAATSTTLAASATSVFQTQPLTLTATTSSAATTNPSGQVTFNEGPATLGTSTLSAASPTATLATPTLAPGIHTIIATYTGAPDFSPSTSAPITILVNPEDFAVTTGSSLTIKTEHHAALDITIASIGPFTDAIALTCTNLPQYASCNFSKSSPSILQLAANGTVTTSVLIDTDVVIGYAHNNLPRTTSLGKTITLACLFPAALLFALRRRPRIASLLALALFAALTTITGCSSKYPASTPPGTYTVNITATGQTTNMTHTVPFTLTVTQ